MASSSPHAPDSKTAHTGVSRWPYLICLMFAGESIYMLPYMRKSFQTSIEEAFAINAIELGLINGMFGVLALACYLPGGWLADRFPARWLLSISLLATGLGGYAMLIEGMSFYGLMALHAFWGVTSVLTFWAALIKATREWGGPDKQGLSFGLLDGGRGIVAACLITIATMMFAFANTPVEGVRNVITLYATSSILAAIAVWVFVREPVSDHKKQPTLQVQPEQSSAAVRAAAWQRVRVVIARNDVWLLAIIIFSSYFLFLGTYEFAAYAERGYGQSKVFGAQLATFKEWLRPFAALAAGLLADRLRPSDSLAASFALLIASYAFLAIQPGNPDAVWLLWLPVATSALAVFALRGVYYAVMQQTSIPLALTGTTVGFVSLFGYLPDVFAPTLAGWLVVTYPGDTGYRIYFAILALVACLGLWACRRVAQHTQESLSKQRSSP
ncbi:MAG: MFS transporter [Pseudomonadota bacterium]